jgi:ABC-type transport system involved in cytochrome c biogenesis permease subunit
MNILLHVPELPWIWMAVAAYAATTTLAVAGVIRGRQREGVVLGLLLCALLLIAVGIAVRWVRVGHGPFANMFDILISNLFSLGLVYALAYWRFPEIRPTSVVALPLILLLGVWLLVLRPTDSHLPPTYDTPWLWVHVAMGKVFLGTCLVAVGLAGVMLLRRTRLAPRFRDMPPDASLDVLAWRIMTLALVFESLMLIAGAVWAQDAWGRYWDWDPLEAWAFITWLALAAALHLRLSYRTAPRLGALMIIGVFVLAFLTFFGVPFVSLAPHKGMV